MSRELFQIIGIVVIFVLVCLYLLDKAYHSIPEDDEYDEEDEEVEEELSFKELFKLIF